MSLRARVKQEPGDVPDQVCIKQEPELIDVECMPNESDYSPQLLMKEEPVPLEHEGMEHLKQEPMCVLLEVCLPQEIAVKEEPAWMGGPGAPADDPDTQLQHELPPARADTRDVKPSFLVRDCWVRLERCAIPRGAAERWASRCAVERWAATCGAVERWAATCDSEASPHVSHEHERERALKQLSGLLIKPKPNKLYTCDICKKDYNMLPNLIKHKQIHMKKKCEIKYKKRRDEYPLFSVYDRIREPRTAKAGRSPTASLDPSPSLDPSASLDPAPSNLPYMCEICKAVFFDLHSLKVHALIHAKMGKKPYACKVCGMNFSTLDAFKCHSRFHAELRPHPCQVCPKRFSRKCDLHKHMIAHAAQDGACAACEARRALRLLGGLMKVGMGRRPRGGGGRGGRGQPQPARCETCNREI